ncbi:integrase core domain-containing protein [Leuconostoc gelidum subsp. gasicomitatum]|nr:integrase core domain-containing protein [Leuconostoc gasicomitatum]MBZ5953052.1 integrase core domain-containing protein [Leuconostoc gasicomitatum]
MSIRYSQDFKDSLVRLHQEGRSLKSLAEEFGPSKDSIAIWVKQATPIMIKGHPYDNGRMEAFHSILKREEVYLKAYQTLTEVQAAIGWYINFYNRNRISNVA